MVAPRTISSEIIARVNALLVGQRTISEFEQARFKKDIEALKSKDYSTGLMTFGIFYALLGDEVRAFEYHEASLKARPNEPVFLTNFSITLKMFGYLSKSFDYYLKALKFSPADKISLLRMGEMVPCVGRISEYLTVVELYRKAAQDEAIMSDELVLNANSVKSLLDELHLTDGELAHAYNKVELVCKRFSVRPLGCHISRLNAEGHDYLSVEVKVDCDGAAIASLNDSLADEVAEDFEFSAWNKIIHTFTYGLPPKPELTPV